MVETRTVIVCNQCAVLCDLAPDEAVKWVRATYCDRAVETGEQDALVRNFSP